MEEMEREIQRLKQELENVKRESTQYLQNVAHQLTAPLGAIKWSIEAIKDEEVPIQRKMKLLSSVYSQATILVHLIKNFTLMSNLDADLELGQFRDKAAPVDILRLAINLANDFQPQALETEKRIKVEDESFQEIIGAGKLLIEKNLVAQAISNLLENAVKYAENRSTIEISAVDSNGIGICITSTGIAIKPEDYEAIFQRGFRGELARKKVPAGTGIGLYLASRILRLHDGKIEVRCSGRTSTFTLIFPLSRRV